MTGRAGPLRQRVVRRGPPGNLFVGDEPVAHGRMVGIIRAGRSAEVKHELITGLADAWSAVTGEPREGFALFLQEVPGSMVMEYGETLPEAEFDWIRALLVRPGRTRVRSRT